MLDNEPNQPSKFKTKSWFKINEKERGPYITNSQIKFKATMLKLSLCDYRDAYILIKRAMTIMRGPATADAATNSLTKEIKD